MAKKDNTKGKAPKPQGSDRKGESDGILHGLLTVLLSILIVLVVFGGAFYFVLKNNIYGLGEQLRPSLERIPVLKLALPPLPESEDPYDPKHLTQSELLEKYNYLRNTEKKLTADLEDANRRLAELENEKQQWQAYREEADAIRTENENTLKQIQEQQALLEETRKKLSGFIAEGNKEGFKEYFEMLDPDTAREIYTELTKERVVDQKMKDLAKTYQEMEPEAAAQILTKIGAQDMPLLIDLIGAMKDDVAAEIIESMEPEFAADLMKQIADQSLGD